MGKGKVAAAIFAQTDRVETISAGNELPGQFRLEEIIAETVDVEHAHRSGIALAAALCK